MQPVGSDSTAVVAQAFFEALAAEVRRPHVGEHFKTYTHALLLRAQECGLYSPTQERK